MTFNFSGQPSVNPLIANTADTQSSQPAQSNVGVSVDPNSPNSTVVNPLTNSNSVKQTNALTGLAELLRTGNNQSTTRDPSDNRGPNRQPNNEIESSQNIPDQRPKISDNGQSAVREAIAKMVKDANRMNDPVQYNIEAIVNGLRDGDAKPILDQVNVGIEHGVQQALAIVVEQIIPSVIEAAVSQAVAQAQSQISTNGVWEEMIATYPGFRDAENLVRPQLEQAFKNTGDKKTAIESIAAVYKHHIQDQATLARQSRKTSDAFNIEDFMRR